MKVCALFLDEVVAFATAVQKNEGEDARNDVDDDVPPIIYELIADHQFGYIDRENSMPTISPIL